MKHPQNTKSKPLTSSYLTAESGGAPGGPFLAGGQRVSCCRRAREGPGPQAAGLPVRPSPTAGGAGGGRRRNRPLSPLRPPPAPNPRADGDGEGAPGAVPGALREARGPLSPRLPSRQRRAVRPSPPRGWRSPPAAARGEEGWGSKFTPFPVPSSAPPAPFRGEGEPWPSPAAAGLRGPAVSLLWRLGAVEQLPLLGPRPVLQADIPHPSEEMRGRRGGCVRERKAGGWWGQWGAKRSPRVWGKSGAGWGEGAEAGPRHTPLGLASHASPRLPRSL